MEILSGALVALALAAPARGDWASLEQGDSYATGRAGAFILTSRDVASIPVGPDAEVTVGRVILPGVALEVGGGFVRARVSSSLATITEVPVTASVRLLAPLDRSLQPYLVGGAGLYFTRLSLDATASEPAERDERWSVGFHAGLGATRRLGDRLVVGVDARYVFLEARNVFPASRRVVGDPGFGPAGARLDGVRLSAAAGVVF
jgi:opacity protein-like surface antigen